MTSSKTDRQTRLRDDAERRLQSGTAPSVPVGWSAGGDALARLYQLASDPHSAEAALKLLEELQVHQVELGMQYEQLVAAEQEITEDLARYRDLYQWAPVSYFVVDRDGIIVDVNRAGDRLLGVSRDAVIGRELAWFLDSASRPALQDVFTALHGERDVAECEVRFNQSGHAVHIAASVPPSAEVVLMIVSARQASAEA